MAFDPDKYLKTKQEQKPLQEFDPDVYLKKKQPEQPEFNPEAYLAKQPKAETEKSAKDQILEGLTTPGKGVIYGETPSRTYSPEVMEAAKKELERIGYNEQSDVSKAVGTALASFADAVAFGNREYLTAKLDQLFEGKDPEFQEKVYEAMTDIRQTDSPISSLAGTLVGYIGPASVVGKGLAAVGAGAKKVAAGTAGYSTVQSTIQDYKDAPEETALEEAARGVTEGLIFSGAIKAGGKLVQAMKKGDTDAVTKAAKRSGMPDEEADRLAQSFETMKKSYDQEIKTVKDLSDEQVQEFKKILLAGKSPAQYESQRGDLGEALDSYKQILARRKSLLGEEIVDVEPKSTWSGKNMAMSLADGQFVMNAIDRKLGTNLMPKLNQLSRSYNLGQHRIKQKQIESQAVLDQMKSKTRQYSEELINKIEDGVVDSETKPFIDLFENLRKDANEAYGSEVVKKLRDKKTRKELPYVPHYTASAAETRAKLRNRIKEVTGKSVNDLTRKDLDTIRKDKSLMDSYNYLGGYKLLDEDRVLSDEPLLALIKRNDKIGGLTNNLRLDAASVEMRLTEEIPDLIREKDIGKLLNSWINGVYSDAFMRNDIRAIRTEAEGIRDADKMGHSYLINLLTDVTGGRRDTLANWASDTMKRFEGRVLEKALQLEDAGKFNTAEFYRGIAGAPRFLQSLQANMYPYFLGLRADAVVRNLAQPYAMTANAINAGNPVYNAKLAANGAFGTISDIRSAFGEKGKMYQQLVNKGWLPPDPTPGAFLDLQRGLKDSGAFKRGAENFNRRITDFAMYMYTKSDIVNRIATVHMGDTVAKDAIKQSAEALTHINSLPPAYRRRARAALQAKDQEGLADVLNDHLIATTQFHYNKISMSNYGRFFGGAFSMFSKWPTAIGADLYDTVRQARATKLSKFDKGSKATRDLTRKYFGPMIVAMMGDYLIEQVGLKEATLGEERYNEVFGSSISGAMPLQAIIAPLIDPQGAFTPATYEAMSQLLRGDPSTFTAILPGAAYVRFMTERAPAWIENRKGESPAKALGIID